MAYLFTKASNGRIVRAKSIRAPLYTLDGTRLYRGIDNTGDLAAYFEDVDGKRNILWKSSTNTFNVGRTLFEWKTTPDRYDEIIARLRSSQDSATLNVVGEKEGDMPQNWLMIGTALDMWRLGKNCSLVRTPPRQKTYRQTLKKAAAAKPRASKVVDMKAPVSRRPIARRKANGIKKTKKGKVSK